MSTRLCALIIPLTLAILLGCFGSGSPVTPPDPRASLASPTRSIWGLYDILIDTASGKIDIAPLRGAAFECNVVGFLQPPKSPINLINISLNPGSDLPAGKISANVSIKHPFPGTRFCGFDVMGIVMDDYPPIPLKSAPWISCSMHPATLLKNPDGWTRWWNQTEFTTINTLYGYTEGAKSKGTWTSSHILNAFKYFSDTLAPDQVFDPDPSSRNFFSSGSPGINTRTYELQFPIESGKPVIHLKYAVSASWVEPLPSSMPPFSADSYPITANQPEAYKIDIIDDGSTAFYTTTTSGGDLKLLVEVRDWQLNGITTVADEIKSVTIESPQLFSKALDLDLSSALPVAGNQTAVRFPITIANVTPAALGDQLLIVSVKPVNPSTYEPQVTGGSNFAFPPDALAAYNVFEAPIISNPGPSTWHFKAIDYGTFNSNHALDVDSHGNPAIGYRSYPDGNLKYAHHDGTAWKFLDTTTAIDFMEGMRLNSNDDPNFIYCPKGALGVTWGHYDGAVWESWLCYPGWPGTSSSLALDSSDRPHLAIHDGWGTWGVWHEWFDGSKWDQEKLADGEQLIDPSIAVDSAGHAHIMTFYMYGTSLLQYFHFDGKAWISENLNVSGNTPALRVDSQDHLHMAFATGAGGDPVNGVAYAFNDGTGWKFETLDTSSDLRAVSLAIDSQDRPHISYWDSTAKSLKYAYYDGSKWNMELLVPSDVGWRSSISILPGDRPIIAYLDGTNTKILYAWKE